MTNQARQEAFKAIAANRVVAIAPTEDFETSDDVMQYVAAHHDAGCKVIEFVLRDKNAETVICPEVFSRIKERFPDVLLGVGTCNYRQDIQMAKAAGADFAVSAVFHKDWGLVEEANQLDLLYFPSVGSVERAADLITGAETSPGTRKTVHELLSGATPDELRADPALNITTLKVHPGGGSSLVSDFLRLITNSYQLEAGNGGMLPVFFEPSDTVQGISLARMQELASISQIVAFGTTATIGYVDQGGQFVNLIKEKRWDDIGILAGYVMAVANRGPLPPLPPYLAAAGIQPRKVPVSSPEHVP